jgi:SAM-dependent methyltransferase
MTSLRLAQSASAIPSRFIEQQQASMLDAGVTVLDAPCGFGRNSLFLAQRGCNVIAVDIDHERIGFIASRVSSEPRLGQNIHLAVCDLNTRHLPFGDASFGALLIVHFIPTEWSSYLAILKTGGYLLFETMGGQGLSYLQLPCEGQMRKLLAPSCRISYYRERPVGPPGAHAVAVRLVARKL